MAPLFHILSEQLPTLCPKVHLAAPSIAFNAYSPTQSKLCSDIAPSGRLPIMALRTSLPLRPFLGARAFHTAPVVRQIPAVPPPARRTAAELGFNGNQDRTRTLDPALTKPLEVSDSSYLHLPKESQLIGTDRREQHLVSSRGLNP